MGGNRKGGVLGVGGKRKGGVLGGGGGRGGAGCWGVGCLGVGGGGLGYLGGGGFVKSVLTTWLQAPKRPEKSWMPMMAKMMNSKRPNMATELIGGIERISASTTICIPCM